MRVMANHHFHLLTVLPIGACVFPRLLALTWYPHSDTGLFLFSSPTLRRCDLGVATGLRSIEPCYRRLESLSILSAGRTGRKAGVLSLSEAIRSCKQLKHLHCPPLNSAAWNYLSNLPTLVSVTISKRLNIFPLDNNILPFFSLSPSCDSPPSRNFLPFLNFLPSLNFLPFLNFLPSLHLSPFPNVTILRFYVRTASDTITFVQHSEFPSLKAFVMHVDALPRQEAERLFHALSQCKACQTLEVIEVSSREAFKLRSPSDHFPATRQLLCFRQLRTLHLSLDIYLGNDLFLEAMSSWPHIRSLEIWSANLCPPFVTFRGLFTALRLCPDLHHLRLSIDVRNIDVDPEVESFQHTSLLRLTVHSTYVERPKDVALIIFSMLPRVSRVTSYHGERGGWAKVNKWLHSFRLSEIGEHAPTT
jgi:hypothetical protein